MPMHADDRLDRPEEPAVDPGQFVHLVDGHAVAQGPCDGEDPHRSRILQLVAQILELIRVRIQPAYSDVEHAQRLLDHFGKGAADGHHFADALHLASDARRGSLKLGEIPARQLAHEIVEGRLEERRRAARDAVRNFREGASQRDLGCHIGEGIAGRLAGERTRARETGIDLDDPIVGTFRIERVLDVALPDYAKMSNRAYRDRPEMVVFRVVESLRGRNDDRLARVDPHRIHVFHVAHRDAVVAPVPHDFVLDLLPAAQALLDEHLLCTAGEGALDRGVELLLALHDAAALAAQRVSAPQHHREPDVQRGSAGLAGGGARDAAGRPDPDLGEAPHEELAVLGVPDRVDRRSKHAHAVLAQHAGVVEGESAIQRGLAAERKQDRIHLLLHDDALDEFRIDGDEVDTVGEILAGLDSRDVRIDEDRRDTLFAQGLERLRPGVVEFPCLSDLERARSEHQHPARFLRQICSVRGHYRILKNSIAGNACALQTTGGAVGVICPSLPRRDEGSRRTESPCPSVPGMPPGETGRWHRASHANESLRLFRRSRSRTTAPNRAEEIRP